MVLGAEKVSPKTSSTGGPELLLVDSARSSYSHLDLFVIHQLPDHFSDHTGPQKQHSYLAPLKHSLGKTRGLRGHYRTLLGHDLGTTYAQIGHYLDTQTY